MLPELFQSRLNSYQVSAFRQRLTVRNGPFLPVKTVLICIYRTSLTWQINFRILSTLINSLIKTILE